MHLRSLKTKLDIAFLIVLFLPLTTATIYSVGYFSKKIEQAALARVSSDLDLVTTLLSSQSLEIRYLAQSYARMVHWGELLDLGLTQSLQDRLEEEAALRGLDQILVIDWSRKIIVNSIPSGGNETSLVSREFLDPALSKEVTCGFEHIASGKRGDGELPLLSLTASAPLYYPNQNQMLGAVVIRRFIQSEFLQAKLPDGLAPNTFVFAGDILVASNLSSAQVEHFRTMTPSIAQALFQRNMSISEVSLKPGGYLAKYQPLFDPNGATAGAVMVKMSADDYVSTRSMALASLFGIAVIWLLLTLFIKYMIQRNILRPIREFTRGTRKIASGDYAYRLEVKTRDEIGNLSEAFNQMAQSLEQRTGELQIANQFLSREITERKCIEEALRKSQSQLTAILNNTPDMAWLKDRQGRFLAVNDAFAAATGMKQEDIIHKTDLEVWTKSLAEKYRADDEEVMRSVKRRHFEEPVVDREGRTKWLETVKTAILDETGKVVGTAGIARDITLRRLAEASLQTAHQELQDIIEFLPDATFVIDEDCRVIAWNRAMEEMTGVPKREVLWEGDHAYSVPFYGAPRPILIDLVRSGESPFESAYESLEKHGSTLYAETFVPLAYGGKGAYLWAKASPLYDREGNLIGAIESIRDITDRKKAEESLLESEKRLRHLSAQLLTAQEEERRRISREVHDSIASSLAAINISLGNTLSHLERGLPAAESIKTSISITQNAIEESRRIMSDLRPSVLDDLGILATIDWLCRQYETVCPDVCLEKEIAIEEEEIPEILKIAIFRVLQEALNNVAKHSEAELVNLSLVKRDGEIELIIDDNGIGFDLNKILLKGNESNGVGIASMRERTELSGGRYNLESVPGEGTVIRCSWPAEDGYEG
jgi:PAS domain S-box-containing protein